MIWSLRGIVPRRRLYRSPTGLLPPAPLSLPWRVRGLGSRRSAFARLRSDRRRPRLGGILEKFVKEAAENSPSKLFKGVRGTTKVWDLAVRTLEGWASSPGEVATSELRAWSKLWKPGHTVREPGGHPFREPRLP
eukprot:2248983-Amphidinium_carterae.1